MSKPDPRVTIGRGSSAAIFYSTGVGVADLRAQPDILSRLETQVLFGENFAVHEEADGWTWGRNSFDGYVGYVRREQLVPLMPEATHRVASRGTHVYHSADVKAATLVSLPMNAKLRVAGQEGAFAVIAGGGFVPLAHIVTMNERVRDYVAVAEMFVGVPYLWGGRTIAGVDCSGLVQCALERAGLNVPRDSDMQESVLGEALAEPARIRRGDLVFWSDHVGIMCDERVLLHANSFLMMTGKELLSDVVARSTARGSQITSVRRIKF